MVPITEIFYTVDEFCKTLTIKNEQLLFDETKKRQRSFKMSLSEMMTILILFHFSHYRTFKDFYLDCVLKQYRREFPNYVSYNRFVELMEYTLLPLTIFLHTLKGEETGCYFIDSTKLSVCDNLRIKRHKVFKHFSTRGKTSTGWFFGFKLHLVFNHLGEIVNYLITPANVDDRKYVLEMMKNLKGLLIGDRGYISSKLKNSLKNIGVELVTKFKKNMKKYFIEPIKLYLLSCRNFVETSIDQLKNLLHIQHTRHRSVTNFQVNLIAGLIAFCLKPNRPSIKSKKLTKKEIALMSN